MWQRAGAGGLRYVLPDELCFCRVIFGVFDLYLSLMCIRYLFFFLLSFFMATISLAQTRAEQETDALSKRVQVFFKRGDMAGLYDLTDSSFHKHIGRNAFIAKFGQVSQELGSLDSVELKYRSHGFSFYKASFRESVMLLTLASNGHGLLGAFGLGPFAYDTPRVQVATDNGLGTPMDRLVDSVVRPFMLQQRNVGMSVGVLHHGKRFYYNYGETRRGNGVLPDSLSLYEIGSISKTFTATILALLVREHKLELDSPITHYLPDSLRNLRGITIRELSNHTSGIPSLPAEFWTAAAGHEKDPYAGYKRGALFYALSRCVLQSEPGHKYAYSNMGVALLGQIEELVTGLTYAQLVAKYVAQPLGMVRTVQEVPASLASSFVTGHDGAGDPTTHWNFDAFAAAGSLRSCTADMLTYAAGFLGAAPALLADAFARTRIVTFTASPAMQLGLGWHQIHPGGQVAWFHNGGTGGFRSMLLIDVATKDVVVLLANAANEPDELAVRLLRELGAVQ